MLFLRFLRQHRLVERRWIQAASAMVIFGIAMGLGSVAHNGWKRRGADPVSPRSPFAAVAAASELKVAGLSRKRPDFDKALAKLGDAAKENPRLAEYYKRVDDRVRGRGDSGRDGSGVQEKKAEQVQTDANTEVASPGAPSAEVTGTATAPRRTDAESFQEPAEQDGDLSEQDADSSSELTVGDLAFPVNPAVQRWVHYYSETRAGRQTMSVGINRSSAYLAMARREFRQAGVPEDLVWLAHVESVWNPSAVSPAAAGGIWQFVPKTASEYGLTVESANDERADPLKQTRAAAAYLRDLHTLFGDWALAMAAYNSGEPRVMDAVIKNDGRADFWDLYDKHLLPNETRDYVPKILAAIDVASQARSYGFASPDGTATTE